MYAIRSYYAAADFVEDLAAELEVVALLIDRVRSSPDDVDAPIGGRDEIIHIEVALAGEERDVGHPLKLHVRPRLGVGAAVRARATRVGANPLHLIAGRLVVHQDP